MAHMDGTFWHRAKAVLPALPAFAILAAFFVYPVGALLSLSLFNNAGELSAEHYMRMFTAPVYFQVIWITLKISLYVTVLCLLIGYPIAYLISMTSPETRRRLVLCILIPFWTSFLVRTFALIIMLGRTGPINEFLLYLGIINQPLALIYNWSGLMFGMVHAMLPLAVLTMLPVMSGIDPNLSRAGAILGGSGEQVFWRVYFPLSLPGVAAAAVLVYLTAMGFFITPALLGGANQTMISQIIIRQVQELLNWRFAGALSLLLLATTALLLWLYSRVFGLGTLIGNPAAPQSGRKRDAGSAANFAKPSLQVRLLGMIGGTLDGLRGLLRLKPSRHLARPGAVLMIFCGIALAFLVLPSLVLLPISFSTKAVLTWPPAGFSWRWYDALFSSSFWLSSVIDSLWIGVLTGVLSVAIGTAAAFAVVRGKIPGRGIFLGVALAPLIIPRVIIGVGLMYFFAQLYLIDTITGIVIGHIILALPYALVTVMAKLRDYNVNLDQAAWTLGASPLRTLMRITLPLLWPSIITAFVFAFITSFDDVTVSLFLSGSEVTTLPRRMWSEAFLQVTPILAAVSTISIVIVTVLLVTPEVLRLIRRRSTSGA